MTISRIANQCLKVQEFFFFFFFFFLSLSSVFFLVNEEPQSHR